MKCCSKAGVLVAMVAGLGIAALAVTGVGPAVWERAKHKLDKQVPPEVKIEQLKLDVSRLDKDIDKNWSLIAKYEYDVKTLKNEITAETKESKVIEKELAAAADEFDAKAKFVTYKSQQYSRDTAARKLESEAKYLTSLKNKVESKTKLLAAREQKLAAATQIQEEMKTQKAELAAAVERLQADLEMLNLRRTESKLPTTDRTRLDNIKTKLNKLQEEIEIETRANDLRESHNGRSTPTVEGKDKISSDETVMKKVREALGNNNNVAKGDE